MSVEACKWARMADVQKSSSKLILLSLAQLVRYDAQDWTVFASIEYLAKVTHLNRKTVIEALARLRQLGAIQDTLMRAGENRSSVVYRLCPNAVPRIDMATSARQADHQPTSTPAQQGLTFEPPAPGSNQDAEAAADVADHGVQATLSCDRNAAPPCPHAPDLYGTFGTSATDAETTAGATVASMCNMVVGQPSSASFHATASLTTSSPTASATPAAPAAPTASQETPTQMRRARADGHRRQAAPAMYRGAGATRLPAGWSLPARWRIWAQRERPHWTAEKIDAMAATFSAYMRSRPGEAGMSEDWFESWRLWVFREREVRSSSQKSWHTSWAGIVAKGKALGLEPAPDEPPPYFKDRVFRAAGLAPPP